MKKEELSNFFKSLNYLGMGLNLYACAGFIGQEIGFYSVFFDYMILFPVYILGQIVNAVVFARQKAGKKPLITLIKLSFYLSILSLWDLIAIILFLPFLLFSMFAVQGSSIVFFVSGALLCMYGYQNFIGDIEGYRPAFASWRHALVGFIVFVSSGALAIYLYSLGEGDGDYFLDKGVELADRIRSYFISAAEECMEQRP